MRDPLGRAAAALAGLIIVAGCQAKQEDVAAQIHKSLSAAAQQSQQSNDYVGAVNQFRTLYERDPKSLDAALGLVRNLRFVGRPEQSMAVANEALAAHPDDAALLAELGKSQLAANQLPAAIDTLNKAIARDPRSWQAHSALGIAYDRKEDHAAAQRAYRTALGLSPGSAAVINNLALSLALSGDLDAAIAELQKVAFTERSTTQLRQNLALFYALSGNMRQAEAIVRNDLPPELAEQNLAYYRSLAAARSDRPAAAPSPAQPRTTPP